jgi:hypothetical protein
MSRMHLLIGAVVGAVLAGASVPAHAVPTTTVDGVTFPIGLSLGGNQIQSGVLSESLINGVGDTLSGIGIVNSIGQGLNTVWSNGDNGVELVFYFTGFVATSISGGTVDFTGGVANFYVLAAGTPISGFGSFAADVAAIQAGTLWLSTAGAPQNPAGNTLISNLTTTGTIGAFTAGSGNGFLDVTGGDAAGNFDTNTFANAFDLGGYSDLTLTSDFTNGQGTSSDGLPVGGSATVKANAIPEPISLGLLGIGLLGLGMARRRKS